VHSYLTLRKAFFAILLLSRLRHVAWPQELQMAPFRVRSQMGGLGFLMELL
jgi:hypothetical protein